MSTEYQNERKVYRMYSSTLRMPIPIVRPAARLCPDIHCQQGREEVAIEYVSLKRSLSNNNLPLSCPFL